MKHPKYNELLTVSVPSEECADNLLPVAVSVIGQVFVLNCNTESHRLTASHVVRRSRHRSATTVIVVVYCCFSETNCSALAFSSGCSPRLACGLTNGSVEFYSADLRTLIATLDFHEASVNGLLWMTTPHQGSSTATTDSNESVAVVCSADAKLSLAYVPVV